MTTSKSEIEEMQMDGIYLIEVDGKMKVRVQQVIKRTRSVRITGMFEYKMDMVNPEKELNRIMTVNSTDLFLVVNEQELNEGNRTYKYLPIFKQVGGNIFFVGFVTEEKSFSNGVLLKWRIVQEFIRLLLLWTITWIISYNDSLI